MSTELGGATQLQASRQLGASAAFSCGTRMSLLDGESRVHRAVVLGTVVDARVEVSMWDAEHQNTQRTPSSWRRRQPRPFQGRRDWRRRTRIVKILKVCDGNNPPEFWRSCDKRLEDLPGVREVRPPRVTSCGCHGAFRSANGNLPRIVGSIFVAGTDCFLDEYNRERG